MFEFVKKRAFLLFVVSLAMGMAGCSDDDPDYDNVTPPHVAVAANTLTGVITDLSGEPLSGATVTLGSVTASSNESGVYLFDDVKAGTYAIKAEATGKLKKESEITVTDSGKSQNLVWNASLATDQKVEVTVSSTEESTANVETETLKGNDLAEVNIETNIPADAIETGEGEEVKVIISPIYDGNIENARTKVRTRAGESVLLVGAGLSCNKTEVTLNKPVELGFNVDEEVAQNVGAKQYKNGQWVTVASRIEGNKVVIDADEFTAYGLFLGVSFSVSDGSEAVSFEQNEWNNLYGAKDMQVGSVGYTYKTGTEIATKGTSVLTALLVEKLAQAFGATVSTVEGNYPLNVTLPVGTALTVSGTQSKQGVSASAMGKTVSGTHYGTVTVVASTYNRQHDGGTND